MQLMTKASLIRLYRAIGNQNLDVCRRFQPWKVHFRLAIGTSKWFSIR